MRTGKPTEAEYAPYYAPYVALVPEDDVVGALDAQIVAVRQWARSVAPSHETFRYAPGKWSIREVVGHLADTERVFGYRGFCISRRDVTPLPGFDETEYVQHSQSDTRTLADLVEDFALQRQGNLSFMRHLDASGWRQMGTANDKAISVRALAYLMVGHVRHHLGVLAERYGSAPASR